MISADLARLLRRERDALVRHLPAARAGDVRAVHRARVASRRLRELVPVVEAGLDRREAAVRREVRRLTRALGPVREMDVTRALLAATWEAHGWPAPALARVDRTCAGARDARRHDMEARLARSAASDLPRQLSQLAATVAASGDGRRAGALLASRLRQRARAMGEAVAHVGTLYQPAALHAVRIAGKKLRYSLEIAHGAAGLSVARHLKELKAVQELLGGINDRQAMQAWLQTTAGERGVGRQMIHTLTTCTRAIDAECREMHAKFLKRLPRITEAIDTAGREAVFDLLAHRPTRMRAAHRANDAAAAAGRGTVSE